MKIKEFSDIKIGYAFRERMSNVLDGKVKVIQPKNITPEGFVFGKEEPLKTNVSASKSLQSGDVLVVNRGRFAASVFNLSTSNMWITPSSVLILSIKDTSSILPEYVALYFNSVKGQKMFQCSLEQTTIPFISAKNFGDMDIPIPSLEHQHSLIDFEKTTISYAKLSKRKRELCKQILNYKLSETVVSVKRRKL